MKLHQSRTFAEHKLVQRLLRALLALLLLPLLGIVVGAVFWWNLERGLLAFNLLGIGLFAAFTYPFWRGERQKKRRMQLFFSAGSVLLSTFVSVIFDHVVAAYALYFAAACEAFSLIPWMIEVLQEIRRGDWQDWQPPPPLFQRAHSAPYSQRMDREAPLPRHSPVLRTDEIPYQGPELPPPPPPWKLLLPLILAAAAVSATWLWQGGAPPDLMALRYPSAKQVAAALEERYGEPFQVEEVFYQADGLRTWRAFPTGDPSLSFTVATGPAAPGVEDSSPFAPSIGEDNYLQHAWNARVVPILRAYGVTGLPLSITAQDLERGSAGGLQLPEPFAGDFPSVYTGSTLVGWYLLPLSYWAGEEESWEDSVRQIDALLKELRPIAPFAYLGSWSDKLDGSLQSLSWHNWILPVAVKGGFVGIPIAQSYTRREILSLLEESRPYCYYYIEDGMICRPSTFDKATPVPVPERPK